MKSIFKIALFALILTACGNNDNSPLAKKKKQLEQLILESEKLHSRIQVLKEEIAQQDTSKSKDEALEVGVLPISASVFSTYIDVQGRVDADQNVAVSSQMPGTITLINVKTGQTVSKGQVLAETDASALYQQISDLETSLSFARQIFQKQENLWKQNIGTELQYLQAKTNKESLEKKRATMNEQVRMSKIISPINGTVDAINIKIGQMVAPGMAAVNVINFTNLKVKADLAESLSSRVKTGNVVKIYFPDINDSIIGKINYAARAINPLTRTFGVEVILSDNKKYHPNMVAKLKINDYNSSKPVIIVPVKFIQKGLNEAFVMVSLNGIAVKKIIKISKEYNGMAEIAEGLSEGELLITEGYDLVNEGEKITLKK